RRARPKQKIDTQPATKFLVLLFRTRITFVIASRFKLERIYKNTDDDFATLAYIFARDLDQFAVRVVQRAHRWHQHSTLSRFARRNVGNRFGDLHAAMMN